MRNIEIELDNIVTSIPECWYNDFCLKNRVTDLLSVSIITGFEVTQTKCPNSLRAKNIAKSSSA